jgi:gag-polyprotein putative aspartyl protease/Domain of unknown function (DUF4124)
MNWCAMVLAASFALALPVEVKAQPTLYRWTDDRGVVHFSDTGVPGKYARGAEERTVEANRPHTTGTSQPPPAPIPLNVHDGKRFVHVTLEGPYRTREMQMIVDTGAQMTMIDEDVAEDLDVQFVRDVGIVGVSGVIPGWIGRLQRLKVGDKELSDLEVMVGPLPGLQLIGTDVLDQLELTIAPNSMHKNP